MFKTTFRTFLYELLNMFRKEALITIIVVASVGYFFYYPLPYNHETVRNTPTVVVDHDLSTMSKKLIRKLNATDSIEVVAYVDTMAEAEHLLRNREVYGIFWIPFGFEQNILSGRSGEISYYGDASYMIIYSKITASLQGAIKNMSQEISAQRLIQKGVDPSIAYGNSAPITPVIVPLYNPQDGYETYVIPPVYILIVYQFLFIGVMISIVINRGSKEDKFLMQAPNHSPLMVTLCAFLAKWFCYVFIGFIMFFVYTGLAPIFYQLPFLGNITNLWILGFLFLSSTVFLGMVLAQFFKKFEDIFMIVMPSSMLFFFTSGMTWPSEMISAPTSWLTYIFPIFPGITSAVKLNQMGGSLESIKGELINLIILMIIYGALAFASFYRYYKSCYQTQLIPKPISESPDPTIQNITQKNQTKDSSTLLSNDS